jgi:transcription-repair coupling factor (superfamily II helicase)
VSFFVRHFTYPLCRRVIDTFEQGRNITLSGSASYSSRVLTVADILQNSKKKFSDIIWVVNNTSERDVFAQDIPQWTGIPAYCLDLRGGDEWQAVDLQKCSREDRRYNSIEIAEFVSRFFTKEAKALIIPASYFFVSYPSKEAVESGILRLKKGDTIHTVQLFEQLISMGYNVGSDKDSLQKGEYYRSGEMLFIWPVNLSCVVKIEISFDVIENINGLQSDNVDIFSITYNELNSSLISYFDDNTLFVEDELDITDDFYDKWNTLVMGVHKKCRSIVFTLFNADGEFHQHLHYLSFLKFTDLFDFTNDLVAKRSSGWNVLIFTKNKAQLVEIFHNYKIPFSDVFDNVHEGGGKIYLIEKDKDGVFPYAFQNPEIKLAVLTDKEISVLREDKRKITNNQRVFSDLMSGLKIGDFVVHADHGIAVFLGLEQLTIDEITREYLKLGYAENDKLFVPIDQADKVSKYIGSEDSMPKLTRLGSSEWASITSKVKKETEIIAQELLKLYAMRKQASGFRYPTDDQAEHLLAESFPYEETPGQIKAILDVKKDMEGDGPMDRLVCGDVGFGKTEVAVRAAFKAVRAGKQVAFISPITILTDQHYRTFTKRMADFDVRIAMMSRFVSAREQKLVLDRLRKGEVDIVIGTHRLLQDDVEFKDLGLIIIDEEQRFGVTQKEALKKLKVGVDVLTLTATPIPRTLNIALNKLRDVTTITTPPPGRLPIITEVRKFSMTIIREAILREVQRGGQVYFLHNKVQTIDSMAQKLRQLIPEARIGVAHGQMGSSQLEEKIIDFKDHKFDVLVSSTIIENGIDLPNANTLLVNHSEKFGLAQLYQLRGRIGRGKVQAYAYFLYHGQRLKLDAKRRLKAIVEASELGSGFQIAMKDLEIRGAGEILGAKQHGVINVVGVSHFIRMLNKAVEDLNAGKMAEKSDEPEDISVELPLTCYIPDSYIVSSKDKISVYQKMAGADTFEYLNELKEEVVEDYGKMPKEVMNLFKVIELKIYAKKAGVLKVKAENVHLGKEKQVIILTLSKRVKPENIMNLLEHYPGWQISGTKLQMGVSDMGMQWLEVLEDSLVKLADRIVGLVDTGK